MTEHVSTVILPSAARTAAVTGPDLVNLEHVGLILFTQVTVDPGTGTITVTIQGKDETSGVYYDILAGAALAAPTTQRLMIHPALTAAANLVDQDLLPRIWRVNVAVGGAGGLTYSIGATLLAR